MTKIRFGLRKKYQDAWFSDSANDILDSLKNSPWSRSNTGSVWTHTTHGGKVRFLRQTDGYADYVKIWHPSGRDFDEAQVLADFVQWVYDNMKQFTDRIEIIV